MASGDVVLNGNGVSYDQDEKHSWRTSSDDQSSTRSYDELIGSPTSTKNSETCDDNRSEESEELTTASDKNDEIDRETVVEAVRVSDRHNFCQLPINRYIYTLICCKICLEWRC